jgi:16S rRNA (guanine966-N2)-methyltransferase
MRITGGELSSLRIPTRFASHVRPSTDRVRESLFNSLQNQGLIEGADVLDLFAGSGIMSAEFLSRGAAAVTALDRDGKNIANLKSLKALHDRLSILDIVKADVWKWQPGVLYDLIFADPPYDMPSIQSLPDRLLPWLKPGGKLLVEHKPQVQFAQPSEQTRTYGSTTITIFVQP